jgi:hypothetical protein
MFNRMSHFVLSVSPPSAVDGVLPSGQPLGTAPQPMSPSSS